MPKKKNQKKAKRFFKKSLKICSIVSVVSTPSQVIREGLKNGYRFPVGGDSGSF
jgi:transposase-like protein